LHERLAAETHLADGEFLQVAVNREVSEITRENWNTGNNQKREAKFHT
jgi:hypothetical protein